MEKHWKLIAAGIAAAGIATTVAAKEYRSADVHPEDYPTVMAVKFMSDQIKQKTGGKDSIKVYTGNQLGGEKDTIEQVKIGALDLVRINVAPMNNICAETMVPTMPFLFKSKEHMRHVLDGPIGDQILKACEPQGYVGLAFYDSGSRSIYTTKKQIKTLADVKGLKIRVQQSDLWVALLQAMGANATPIPYGEVYTSLKTGVVDGAENNWPSYDTARHFEVAPYYSLTEHSMAPEMLLMSKKVYDALTPAEQQMFRDAAKASVPYMRKLWDEKELASRKVVEAGGAKVDRGRQEGVPGRDEARVRQVHHGSEAQGHGEQDPGDELGPFGPRGGRRIARSGVRSFHSSRGMAALPESRRVLAQDMNTLLTRLARINDRLGRWALWLSGLGLLVMTAITGWQVFGRYVMNDSPQWVERIALLLVLYFSFLAGAVGVREESHLGIAFVNDALPPGLRKAVMVVVGLILAAFGAVLAWNGVMLVHETWDVATPIIRIPEGATYFAIPLGGLLIFSFAIELTLRELLDRKAA